MRKETKEVSVLSKRYSIGEVSEICGVPIKTLRYYDEIGLLTPEYRNQESKYRYYSKGQMINLFIIRQFRTLGLSLKEIKQLFADVNIQEMEKAINRRLREISEEINKLENCKAAGENLMNRLHRGGDILSQYNGEFASAYNEALEQINIEKIPEAKMIFSRSVMEKYENAEVSLDRWIEITDKCMDLKLSIQSPIIVTYYGEILEQYLMKDCDVEFGVLVGDEKVSGEDFRIFGGFEAITKIHVGKYSEIIKSHVSMIQWMNQNGYELAGPVSEEFIISPVDIDNENEHITKIIMPVRKCKQEKEKQSNSRNRKKSV